MKKTVCPFRARSCGSRRPVRRVIAPRASACSSTIPPTAKQHARRSSRSWPASWPPSVRPTRCNPSQRILLPMQKRYFGTDGIRGRAGEPPITADFMVRLGRAAGRVLARDDGAAVLIGKDTRISGYMLESALEAGLVSAGANVRLLGPMPTPAVAYLTRQLRGSAGIVISASHNPYWDNGIKFFDSNGEKLADEAE